MSKTKLKFLAAASLATLGATMLLPIMNLKPQQGSLAREQQKLIAVAELIKQKTKQLGRLPSAVSELRIMGSSVTGWDEMDSRWQFRDPTSGKGYEWILTPEKDSFIIRSPYFFQGQEEVCIQWDGQANRLALIRR